MKPALTLIVILFLFSKSQSQPIARNKSQPMQSGTEVATNVVKTAYPLTLQGDFDSSLQLLNRGLNDCRKHTDSGTCKSIIYFNIGFLNERRFQLDNNVVWLDAAIDNYNKILVDFPNDKGALERIAEVFLAKNEPEQATRTIQTLIKHYPNEQYRFRMMTSRAQTLKGDLYGSINEVQKAIDVNPFKEEGWRHLISLYEKDARYQTLNNVIDYAYTCSGYGYPTLALEVLQSYIRNHHQKSDAEIALSHWANLLIKNNLFTLNRLSFIPTVEQWPSRANVQLHKLFYLDTLSDLEQWNLEEVSYWNSPREIGQDDYRFSLFEVLSKVMKAFGDNNRIRNNMDKAERFYSMAIEIIKSHNRDNDEIPVIYFETANSLANLYYYHPELDPGDEAYTKLTRDLFSGKNSAYSDANYSVIKKYHITLGMIYAQKGIWKSSWADNAQFQLEHAIKYKGEDEYLPYIHSLLADGYLNHLSQKESGIQSLLNAVEEYLMIDDPKQAFDNLAKAENLIGEGVNRNATRLNAYKEIIQLRNNFAQELSGVNARVFNRRIEEFERKMDSLRVNKKFIDYQKFKILSAIGNQATGNDASSQKFISYHKALVSLRGQQHLSSYNDLVNFQRIKSFLTEEIRFANPEIIEISKTSLQNRKSGAIGQKHHYSLIIDESNVYNVAINNILFEAGEIASYFAKTNRRQIPEITVGENQVIIKEERTTSKRREVIENDVKEIIKEKRVYVQ